MGVIYKPRGRAAEYAAYAINHYIGCGHGCTYCYVPLYTHNENFHKEQRVRVDVLNKLRKEIHQYAGMSERVLLSFTCDPYQPLDCKEKVTREVLKILVEYNVPFQVLTKGGLRAVRDFDLYRPCDAFGTTLTSLDDKWSEHYEPNAALPESRIKAMERARDFGIETWVSLEPVLDPQQTLDIIRQLHDKVDLFKIGKLNHVEIDVDWREFGIAAIEVCRQLKAAYVIKKDLAAYLDGIEHVSCPAYQDYCPYQNERCVCWDNGCQAEQCVKVKDKEIIEENL